MKLRDMYPSNYMAKEDVPHPITLTIAKVAMEKLEFEGELSVKPCVMWAEEDAKCMILNRGNAGVLANLYGDDTDGWTGKKVEVYVDANVMYMGRIVGGLRVRAPQNHRPMTDEEAARPQAGRSKKGGAA
jgi:hypothetical protein